MNVSRVFRLALGDFLERTRRTSFLVSLAVMVWLGHGMLPRNGSSYRTFVMSDQYRPVYDAAWVGTLTAMLTGLYFLMIGHYVVKGSIERDRRTGVGAVLAATRMSRSEYLWAKTASHFAVFVAMALVAAAASFATQQLLGEDTRIDVVKTLVPFLAITLPTALFAAATAVLFECVPLLRGGLGNVAWFFAFSFLLSIAGLDSHDMRPWRDLTGARAVAADVWHDLHDSVPGATGGPGDMNVGVNINPKYRGVMLKTFPWNGLRWSGDLVLSRLVWTAAAMLLVALGTLAFDRFEHAPRSPLMRGVPLRWPFARARRRTDRALVESAAALTPVRRGTAFGGVLRAELLLALHGQTWWWWGGALVLLVGQLVAPLAHVKQGWLPVATFWPVLVWSAAGQRELRDGVDAVLFSCARPVSRLLPGAWAAGALVGLAIGAPALVRFALAGDLASFGGWALGAAFASSLALALGVWSGNSRFFEVLWLFLWYIGPMHAVPLFDYTGVTATRPPQLWAAYSALTAGLIAAAWVGRERQLRA